MYIHISEEIRVSILIDFWLESLGVQIIVVASNFRKLRGTKNVFVPN